ncbi:MAG: hypothetical protein HFH60_01535 [Lachnospiraceae bacterium]|nr:hypothetical protein [Lachnospiraceae bacterium]
MGRRFLCQIIEVDCAVAVACLAGRWVIRYTYLERGHAAVGGEWLFILLVYWAAYKAAHKIFSALSLGSAKKERPVKSNGAQNERMHISFFKKYEAH